MFSFIYTITRLRHICLACIVVFGMTALVACGGSSGGSGGTDNDNTAPTAAITSPADGTIYTYGDTIIFQ